MITVPTVTNIYINILDHGIGYRIHVKKEISKNPALKTRQAQRLNFIHSFLGYDLNKYELLEHAAAIALSQCDEQDILERISQFYYYREARGLIKSYP